VTILVVLGSARGDSHTLALVDAVLAGRSSLRIDLRDLDIQHYEYGGRMERDDFCSVVEAMIEHDIIVFATPVYWSAMSGRLKVLFDRLTDLVTVRKDLGRRLKDRRMIVLACGSDSSLPVGFETPFRETAAYLSMVYVDTHYAQTDSHGLTASSAAVGLKIQSALSA